MKWIYKQTQMGLSECPIRFMLKLILQFNFVVNQ